MTEFKKKEIIMARTINGKTTTLALIGDPVGHSLSPQMHNYACELLGLDYVYVAYTVKEDGVPAALDAMRALGIRGFNVTMPCTIAGRRASASSFTFRVRTSLTAAAFCRL